MKDNAKSFISLVVSMTVFGTIGIFSKHIPLPTGVVAFARSAIGLIFLVLVMLIMRKKPDFAAIGKNLFLLLLSGVCLAANWILFFAACRNTTVATATLSYYLAPVIIASASVIIFKERIGVKKGICLLIALIGMTLASGIFGGSEGASALGIFLGIGAAFLYAAVVLLNKLMKDINSLDKTAAQFAVSSLALLPYVFLYEDAANITLGKEALTYAIIVGIVHTGLAYVLYFGAAAKLTAGTVAVYSYIDPVVSILVSTIIYKEPIGALGIIGALLMIGASAFSEINIKNRTAGEEK